MFRNVYVKTLLEWGTLITHDTSGMAEISINGTIIDVPFEDIDILYMDSKEIEPIFKKIKTLYSKRKGIQYV